MYDAYNLDFVDIVWILCGYGVDNLWIRVVHFFCTVKPYKNEWEKRTYFWLKKRTFVKVSLVPFYWT